MSIDALLLGLFPLRQRRPDLIPPSVERVPDLLPAGIDLFRNLFLLRRQLFPDLLEIGLRRRHPARHRGDRLAPLRRADIGREAVDLFADRGEHRVNGAFRREEGERAVLGHGERQSAAVFEPDVFGREKDFDFGGGVHGVSSGRPSSASH
ncbi:MAG TPA: hypothetical protein VIG36_01365 [Methylocystis sp.]